MTAWLQWLVVGAAVLASGLVAFRALAPFAWRVTLARRAEGRLPDRFRIWLAGQSACDACGGRDLPRLRRP